MNILPEHFYAYVFAALAHDSSFELLKQRYQTILADLVSAKENANCSCRGRVVAHLTEKYKLQEEKDFLNPIFAVPEVKTNAEIQIARQREMAANALSGKIVTLIKRDNYWQDFMKHSANGTFRSFSVVDKGDSVDVYFL